MPFVATIMLLFRGILAGIDRRVIWNGFDHSDGKQSSGEVANGGMVFGGVLIASVAGRWRRPRV